ncbi:MAG: hypothetical protein J5I93_19250 [Pirellulaceae bacterium]|nr:hypothetical protein [Pirellulaceae bacterium]
MPFEKYYDQTAPVTEPACIHLRSKSLYVSGELRNSQDPGEAGNHHCWCNMTQHVLGPDQQHVTRAMCVPGRNCYRDTH